MTLSLKSPNMPDGAPFLGFYAPVTLKNHVRLMVYKIQFPISIGAGFCVPAQNELLAVNGLIPCLIGGLSPTDSTGRTQSHLLLSTQEVSLSHLGSEICRGFINGWH